MGDWDDDNCMVVCNNIQSNNVQVTEDAGNDWGNEPNPKSMDSNDAISFEIDQSNVGMVIGKGGSKIREIEGRFAVQLQIGKFVSFLAMPQHFDILFFR